MKRAELLKPSNRRAFIESCMWVTTKTGSPVRLRLTPAQADLAAAPDRLIYVPKARQLGITTLGIALDLAECLIMPNTNVLFIAQTDEDSKLIGDRFTTMYQMMDSVATCDDGRLGVKIDMPRDTGHLKVFANGSQVVIRTANSEKAGRGLAFHRVHGTEVAFWDDKTASSVAAAALGASGGISRFKCVFESTGNGAAGFFYDGCMASAGLKESSAPAWKVKFYGWNWAPDYVIAANDSRALPLDHLTEYEQRAIEQFGLSNDQLRWYRWMKAAFEGSGRGQFFAQEYPLFLDECFVSLGTVVFPPAMVNSVQVNTCQPVRADWGNSLHVWKEPVPGHGYILVADSASGSDADPSAMLVLDAFTNEQVASYQAWLPPKDFGRRCVEVANMYNYAYIVPERNTGWGMATIDAMLTSGYVNIYYGPEGKAGWHTNEVSKREAIAQLFEVVANGFKIYDPRIPDQMRSFVRMESGRMGTRGRMTHDDLLMCLIIGSSVLNSNPALATGGLSRTWRYRS